MIYDQTKNKYNGNTTKYACVFYGLLQIINDMFGIKLKDKTIVKFVGKLKYFWVLLRWGAYTPVLYKFNVNAINKKLWIKLKVKRLSLTGNIIPEGVTFGVGHKMIWTAFVNAMKKGHITTEDLLSIQSKGGAGHHHTMRRKGDVIHCTDSWGGTSYTMDLDTMKYGVKIGLYYDPIRTIVPADDDTAMVLKYLKEMKTNKRFIFNLRHHDKSKHEFIIKAGEIYKGNFEMRF